MSTAHADDSIGAVGVNDIRSDGILNMAYQQWSGPRDLGLLQDAGVSLYRARIRMDCVDPNGTGSFDFTSPSRRCGGISYDQLVGGLAQRGLTLLPALMNFDASGNKPLAPTVDGANGTPTRARFAAFAAAAARRYGANGSFWATYNGTARPIRSWEIWNEENNGWWWNGTPSASDYAGFFAQTRAALRSADPNARTVVGGMVWDPHGEQLISIADMVKALAATDANAFDALAIHPYTDPRGQSGAQTAADVAALIDQTADVLRQYTGPDANGAPRQQIWLTEMGWSTNDVDAGTVGDALRAFNDALASGLRSRDNVGPVLWYMLRDNSVNTGRDDALGLRMTTVLGGDAGPKPAWGAFADAARAQGSVALPAALSSTGAYVAPPSAPASTPAATSPQVTVVNGVAVRKATPADDADFASTDSDDEDETSSYSSLSARCSNASALPRKAGDAARLRSAVLCLVNARRAAAGLKALKLNAKLTSLTASRARTAVAGRSIAARDRGRFVIVTRSGAKATPQAIVAAWMSSKATKAALMRSSGTVGLAVAVGKSAKTSYGIGVK